MKAGTVVRLPDGREGTVVYHGLDGYGIKWGRHAITEADLWRGGPFSNNPPPDGYEWEPDAMLRGQYGTTLECVGGEWEVIE